MEPTTHQIKFHDPHDLRIHPLIKSFPQWEDDDPRVGALHDDVYLRGIIEPLKITASGQIVDGRHRWRAAKSAGLKEVPCIVVEDNDVIGIAIRSIAHRRHYTKSLLAFLIYPLLQPLIMESNRRRIENLKKGQQIPDSGLPPLSGTAEVLASEHGIDRKLIFQAARVHELFEKDPEYAEQMLKRLKAEPVGGEHEDQRPIGLGAILSGYQGRDRTIGQDRPQTQYVNHFKKSLAGFRKWASHWDKFETDQRREANQVLRETLAEIPSDLRRQIVVEIKRVEKEIEA